MPLFADVFKIIRVFDEASKAYQRLEQAHSNPLPKTDKTDDFRERMREAAAAGAAEAVRDNVDDIPWNTGSTQSRTQSGDTCTQSGNDETPYEVLGVQPDAPRWLVEAAVKAASRKYHPDRGGDEAMMRKINGAWEQIKRERGW